MLLSIVTTVYKSRSYLNEFYSRITKTASKITKNYELIFVDDGCPQQSIEILKQFVVIDKKVRVIELSRNFGHHKAMLTGLRKTSGEFVFLIDCDLEEAPELLEMFWKELMKDDDVDVVFGIQKRRKGGVVERIFGAFFYKIFNFLSDVKLPNNLSTVRLMRRQFVDAIDMYKENEFVIFANFAHAGFKQKGLYINKLSKGIRSYTFVKALCLSLNGLFAYSTKPLVIGFAVSLIMSAIFLGISIVLILKKLLFIEEGVISGWASLAVSVWVVGAVIVAFLGIITLYIAKIFQEVKRRPVTFIRKEYGNKHDK